MKQLLPIVLISIALVAAAILSQTATAAEPTGTPANSYQNLTPGIATIDDVVAALGKPPIETESAHDFRYPVAGKPGLSDRIYFRDGKLALVAAASPDARYPNRSAIMHKFGPPECHIKYQTQEYLEYTAKGLRFICEAGGDVTGVIYFAPLRRRVPAGYPNNHVDLRRKSTTHSPATAPSDFRVGAAQLSIAPESFDHLTASSQSHKLHLAEDLFSRAVVFEKGKTRLVLIGLDVFGMGPWDIEKIRNHLGKSGFDNVVIAMSHTHANVDTIGFYGYYPKAYAARVVAQTIASVELAARRMQPVKELRIGSVEMPLAGGRVVDLVRNGRDPGLVDPTVAVLQAIGPDGAPIVNVVHLACHPEVIKLERTLGLSPDYVGTLCSTVAQELGGQTVFLNGALGGMITPDQRFRTQAAAAEMGRGLAKYAIAAARAATPTSSYRLAFHRRPVVYPITGKSVAHFLSHTPAPFDFHHGSTATEMNSVWIGDAQMITVPGELLPDVALEIQSQMQGRLRLIVGLANGELGYLIPSFDFRSGDYEEQTGPGAAGGEITRSVGLELAKMTPADD